MCTVCLYGWTGWGNQERANYMMNKPKHNACQSFYLWDHFQMTHLIWWVKTNVPVITVQPRVSLIKSVCWVNNFLPHDMIFEGSPQAVAASYCHLCSHSYTQQDMLAEKEWSVIRQEIELKEIAVTNVRQHWTSRNPFSRGIKQLKLHCDWKKIK